MDPRIFILLVVLTQSNCSLTTSISGEVSEDVTFLYKTFPVTTSMRAIIQVDIYYPETSIAEQGHYPIMGVYTENDHINIKKQCTYVEYGQLGNKNLHLRIRNDAGHFRMPRCLKESDDNIHCTGNITIQDFKPRKFSFSFGFRCVWINAVNSLKRLVYNITIHGQTNETNCIQLPHTTMGICKQYIQHTALPNLIGNENMRTVLTDYQWFKSYEALTDMIGLCHQHLEELACHVLVPKSDPSSRQIIHPCREMCHHLRTACSKITLNEDTYLSEKNTLPSLW